MVVYKKRTQAKMIIVDNKDFYIGIMNHCRDMSQDILQSMKNNANTKEIYRTIATDIDQLIISNNVE